MDRLARGRDARQYVEAAEQPSITACSRSASRAASPPTSGSHLLTHDPERTLALLAGERPVQVVIAGKAHPRDDDAKRVAADPVQAEGQRRT